MNEQELKQRTKAVDERLDAMQARLDNADAVIAEMNKSIVAYAEEVKAARLAIAAHDAHVEDAEDINKRLDLVESVIRAQKQLGIQRHVLEIAEEDRAFLKELLGKEY